MNFKKYFPNKWYDVLYLAVYLFLLAYAIFDVICHIKILNGTSVDDSLFNFAGGFIRRGLGGELLFFIQRWLHVPVAWTIYVISVAAYIILAILVVRAFMKRGYGRNVLIMGFALGGALVCSFDGCRRDYIELLLFAVALLAYHRLAFRWWVVAGNAIIIFGIALHEATFFFTVPILVVISGLKTDSLLKSICCWLPSFIMFVFCCIFKGTPEQMVPVVERAMAYAPDCIPNGMVPPLLSYVGADTITVFKTHLYLNFLHIEFLYKIPIPAYLFTFFYFAYVPYITVAMLKAFTPGGIRAAARNNLVRIIVFQFICLIPMFTILSCDIGRVCIYWIMSSLLVWLFLSENECGRLLSRHGAKVDAAADRIFSHKMPGRFLLTLLMLTIGVVYYVRAPDDVFYRSLGGSIVRALECLAG